MVILDTSLSDELVAQWCVLRPGPSAPGDSVRWEDSVVLQRRAIIP